MANRLTGAFGDIVFATVNGTIFTTFVLYYILPLTYGMFLMLSFMICTSSTENFVVSMNTVRVQTVNMVGFVFCLKMCKPDAADHIASERNDNTVEAM